MRASSRANCSRATQTCAGGSTSLPSHHRHRAGRFDASFTACGGFTPPSDHLPAYLARVNHFSDTLYTLSNRQLASPLAFFTTDTNVRSPPSFSYSHCAPAWWLPRPV